MEQITHSLRTGEVTICELPWPRVEKGMLLVRNHYSLVSAGTERSTLKTGRKSLLGKAKERPRQAKQVVDTLRRQGPVQTYRAVVKKLDAFSPLGYSSAGEVIDLGHGVTGFAVGDKVACAGGGYANHAEIVCVPKNLCVRLPKDADLKRACYNTLGAIAIQGIRQADLRLGECCTVIGLGLLGQLTCLLLRASGVKTFGIDIDNAAVTIAKEHCCDDAWVRTESDAASRIKNHAFGLGPDAVIITAASSSLDPINFAGEIARKKGRVVVVGAVPTGFNRNPYWYEKELELKMSCSYGPGRYDLDYEEKGQEYPPAYVRWTENRNMQAFQDLVHSHRIDLDYLTTHEFSLRDAPKAYEMIVNRSEPFLGVVLRYDVKKSLRRRSIAVRRAAPVGKVGIAFIGAGGYAQNNLLPNIPRSDRDVVREGVLTNSGTTSKRVAERFRFKFCTADLGDLLANEDVNTVFIATRHDSHARYVVQALDAGKNVFVEKPLCLQPEELSEIEHVLHQHPYQHLMVGFNRRFAPHATELKKHLGTGPVSMMYRVNAGAIPKGTWIQDTEIGGGRIIGEVCHFVDFLTWMAGSLPSSVHATAMLDPHGLNDTVSIGLGFEDGSIGTVCYFANGSTQLPKEYIEVCSAGLTGIIHDFKRLDIYGNGRPLRRRVFNQDKGQVHMVRQFIQTVKEGGAALITPDEILAVTKACFAVLESIQTRQVVSI
ncbi:MAG: bi-domain-containing oxidoreductase [Phycisphaerales bacterium]|nr:MAG: bi-domain-containing oxidoreductase [Phycisphaerales bacterium]